MDKYKVIGSKMIHTQTEEECADITGKSAKAISRAHYSSWSSSSGIDVSSTIVQEFMSFKTPAESCRVLLTCAVFYTVD